MNAAGAGGVFLNLGLDVEMDGVTYHLSSSFAEKRKWARSLTQRSWSGTGGGQRKTSDTQPKTIALQC